MLKFFEKDEDIPEKDWERIKKYKLDKVNLFYDHNYRNFIYNVFINKNRIIMFTLSVSYNQDCVYYAPYCTVKIVR